MPYVLYTGKFRRTHSCNSGIGINSPPNSIALNVGALIASTMRCNTVGTKDTIVTSSFSNASSTTCSENFSRIVALVPLYKVRKMIDKPLTWNIGSTTSQLSSSSTPSTLAEAFT